MKVSYDPKYNIAYIRFRKKTSGVRTIKISDEVNIDISHDGKIYGIELLNANEQLRVSDNGRLILTDESTGKTVQLQVG